jgi:hypothetical protein
MAMKSYDLFNTTAKPRVPEREEKAAATEQPATGAFITAQSLASFPVASSITVALWQLVKVLLPSQGASSWTAVIIAFIIGMVIYFTSTSDARLNLGGRGKVIAFVIAVINCAFLAMAAMGINTGISS